MKVGDRVIVNGEWDGIEFKNSYGSILAIEDERPEYCIEFDEYIDGHSAREGKPGPCWWVPNYMIKKEDTMKKRIEALEKELAAIKAQLGKKYEPQHGNFSIYGNGTIGGNALSRDAHKNAGRLFDTEEKAEKARDIMVKHDIILKYVIDHAPGYVPNDKDCSSVFFHKDSGKWKSVIEEIWAKSFGTILMPEWVAGKLADDLNNNRIKGV